MYVFPEGTVFDVTIHIPGRGPVDVKGCSEVEAREMVDRAASDTQGDEKAQRHLATALSHFGFTGLCSGDYRVTVYASLPTIQTDEKQTCPRRTGGWGPWDHAEGLDRWEIRGKDKCCNFCGSLHPDRVLELVREHGPGIIDPSDKSYKWYINQPGIPNASFGGIKYYRHHDTPEFLEALRELCKAAEDGPDGNQSRQAV